MGKKNVQGFGCEAALCARRLREEATLAADSGVNALLY